MQFNPPSTPHPHARPRPFARSRRLAALALLGLGSLASARTFTACAEPYDGPPWLYRASDPGGQLLGFTAEIWPQLFRTLGHELRLTGDLPFKRCLQAVGNGQIDFVLGAYKDEDRQRKLAFSAPVQTLTPQVFFRSGQDLGLRSRQDLKRWHGCGVNGSSYAHYGLQASDLDLGARNFRTLIEKLMLGRCDYFVEELEVIAQVRLDGHEALKLPGLSRAPVPGVTAPSLHLAARRGSEAAALLPALDTAFTQALKSGDVQQVWRRHAGDLPYSR